MGRAREGEGTGESGARGAVEQYTTRRNEVIHANNRPIFYPGSSVGKYVSFCKLFFSMDNPPAPTAWEALVGQQ